MNLCLLTTPAAVALGENTEGGPFKIIEFHHGEWCLSSSQSDHFEEKKKKHQTPAKASASAAIAIAAAPYVQKTAIDGSD